MKKSAFQTTGKVQSDPVSVVYHTHSNTDKVESYAAIGVRPFRFSDSKHIYLSKIFWHNPLDPKKYTGIEMGVIR